MFAISRSLRALVIASAITVGGVTSVDAADRTTERPLSQVHFSFASTMPYAPGVGSATAPIFPLAAAAEAAPMAEAAQTRPVELARPGAGSGSFDAPIRRSMYVSFAALQLMDAVSTRKALSAGANEANPLMGGIVRNNAALFAVKAGTAAATTFLAERLAKKHPRRATILMAVLNGAYAAIVVHNYRVANAR